jgi:hypothetical protein
MLVVLTEHQAATAMQAGCSAGRNGSPCPLTYVQRPMHQALPQLQRPAALFKSNNNITVWRNLLWVLGVALAQRLESLTPLHMAVLYSAPSFQLSN